MLDEDCCPMAIIRNAIINKMSEKGESSHRCILLGGPIRPQCLFSSSFCLWSPVSIHSTFSIPYLVFVRFSASLFLGYPLSISLPLSLSKPTRQWLSSFFLNIICQCVLSSSIADLGFLKLKLKIFHLKCRLNINIAILCFNLYCCDIYLPSQIT